jgi:indole-3-pyruvate monooxygenase
VVDYLSDYQKIFDINPLFNTEVLSIEKKDNSWHVETSIETYKAKKVIVSIGPFGKPKAAKIKDMESFLGKVTHSFGYKSGKKYKGHKVLIIDFGNSACEIAIDLHKQGAYPSMTVRSALNVLPRDILGIPILQY